MNIFSIETISYTNKNNFEWNKVEHVHRGALLPKKTDAKNFNGYTFLRDLAFRSGGPCPGDQFRINPFKTDFYKPRSRSNDSVARGYNMLNICPMSYEAIY